MVSLLKSKENIFSQLLSHFTTYYQQCLSNFQLIKSLYDINGYFSKILGIIKKRTKNRFYKFKTHYNCTINNKNNSHYSTIHLKRMRRN